MAPLVVQGINTAEIRERFRASSGRTGELGRLQDRPKVAKVTEKLREVLLGLDCFSLSTTTTKGPKLGGTTWKERACCLRDQGYDLRSLELVMFL